MWMTLLGVNILKMRKRTRVMLRNTMMRVEAPLAMPPVTAFTSAAIVGTGLGVGGFVGLSAVISSSSSSSISLEEGSSQTCVGAVPRDLSLYDILSGIR